MEAEHKTNQDKYDRQIRLWGVDGQRCLLDSKICLLGCDPAGTETLKNLILPGVGNITIVDNNLITERDLGNNFFCEVSDLGGKRCAVMSKYLLELNPDVTGDYLDKDPASLIFENPEYFKNFNLVIANNLSEKIIRSLGKVCTQYGIRLIVLRISGFIGSVRIYGAEHEIIEGKPLDKDIDGYRISCPFVELIEFTNNIDMSKLDNYHHKHIPYFIILIKVLNNWRNTHNGEDPKTFQEKSEFTHLIKQMAKNYNDEDNFMEAVKFQFRAFKKPSEIPPNIQLIMDSEKIKNVTSKSSHFWIFAAGLKKFYEKNKCLPLKAGIPDMTSDTKTFLALREIYINQANKEALEIRQYIQEILGIEDIPITKEEIRVFCNNVTTMEHISYRTIEDEFINPLPIEIFETDCYKWHFALRGNYEFYDKHNRWPTQNEEDINEIERIINNEIIQRNYENILAIDKEICQEIARYGGSQLQSIAAIIGGVAAQEAIKLITHQFKPINNTYVYKGITSEAEVYEF